MFIIFGSPRSGTTVLASTLSLHPYLKVIDQTDFIVPAAFVLDRIDDAEKGRRLLLDFICSSRLFPRSIGPYLNRSDIQDILFQAPYELAGLLIPLYDAIAGRCRKKCCGDKSVADIAYLPILNRGGLFREESNLYILSVTSELFALLWKS